MLGLDGALEGGRLGLLPVVVGVVDHLVDAPRVDGEDGLLLLLLLLLVVAEVVQLEPGTGNRVGTWDREQT